MISCISRTPHLPGSLFKKIIYLLLAAALATASVKAADVRGQLVEAITNDDAEAQIKLVEQFSTSTNALVVQTLTTWRQGAVYLYDAGGDKKIPFLADSTTDADGKMRGLQLSDGQPVKDASGKVVMFLSSDLTPADTTSKLRKAIRATLDLLALSNPNPNIRRDAAAKLGLVQNAAYLEGFRLHLETEKNPEAQKALQEAIAITELASNQRAVQLAAIKKLDGLRSVMGLDDIVKLETASRGKAPELAAAAAQARKDIQQHINFSNFLGTLFHGLSLSSVLLIAAIGLAITFGLMGIINMAHGEMIMIGAYSAYVMQNIFIKIFGEGSAGFNWYFVVALPFSFLTAGLVGMLLERCVIRFLYKRPLESLLATWGVSLVLQQAMRGIFGAANVQVYSPAWLSGNVNHEDVVFAYNRIFVIFFAIGIVFFTWLLLTKTPLGLQVRALMQNRQMAACMGVRADRVNMATFAFGSGLAGMAGACLSQIGNIGPSLGQSHIVDCFMVVVLGGVGNLQGTVSAALGIGVTDQVLQPHLGAVMGKITVLTAIILFLQWRPAGIFATRGRGLEG